MFLVLIQSYGEKNKIALSNPTSQSVSALNNLKTAMPYEKQFTWKMVQTESKWTRSSRNVNVSMIGYEEKMPDDTEKHDDVQ